VRVAKLIIMFLILFVSSLALLPAVSMLGLPPLPGDITIQWDEFHLYMPFTSSFIAAADLTLLYFFLKR
jgi:formate hydrogenlyase subunit 3/multisubunit Na+/H+ antiporter MnhD subunit